MATHFKGPVVSDNGFTGNITGDITGNLSGTSHKIFAAGEFTTAGGDANEAITVTGALATDIAIVTLKTKGATPRTILTAAAATDAINVVLSADPSTDHVLSYMVLRANS